MIKQYKELFLMMQYQYPMIYKVKIRNYIDNMKQASKSNSLVCIAILSSLQEEKEELIEILPDVYKKYSESNFMSSNLTIKDVRYILDEYIKVVDNIGKEFIEKNDI